MYNILVNKKDSQLENELSEPPSQNTYAPEPLLASFEAFWRYFVEMSLKNFMQMLFTAILLSFINNKPEKRLISSDYIQCEYYPYIYYIFVINVGNDAPQALLHPWIVAMQHLFSLEHKLSSYELSIMNNYIIRQSTSHAMVK